MDVQITPDSQEAEKNMRRGRRSKRKVKGDILSQVY